MWNGFCDSVADFFLNQKLLFLLVEERGPRDSRGPRDHREDGGYRRRGDEEKKDAPSGEYKPSFRGGVGRGAPTPA